MTRSHVTQRPNSKLGKEMKGGDGGEWWSWRTVLLEVKTAPPPPRESQCARKSGTKVARGGKKTTCIETLKMKWLRGLKIARSCEARAAEESLRRRARRSPDALAAFIGRTKTILRK